MRPPGGYRTESSVTSPCREPSSQFIVLLHFQIIPCCTSPAPPTSSSTLTRATYSAVDSTICLASFTDRRIHCRVRCPCERRRRCRRSGGSAARDDLEVKQDDEL